jgi:hypothetical protein
VILTLEIPDWLARQLHLDGPEGPRRALEMIALDGYRSVVLSHGQVGELLGMSFHQTEAFLKAHDAPPGLGPEEHLRGLRNLEQMTGE